MKRFKNWTQPKFNKDGWTKYGWRCQNFKGLKLGKNIDIGCFSYLNAKYGIEIGDNVQIGGGVKVYSIDTIDETKGIIIFKKNSKVGANSVILPNVTIGENSIVGACSVVKYRTNIPDNEIWIGIPAKKVGYIVNNKRIYEKRSK